MKQLRGQVVSDKMEKTVVVEVLGFKTHPLYGKKMRFKRRFSAHDELGAKEGQTVLLKESRPRSKTKKWTVTKIISQQGGKRDSA